MGGDPYKSVKPVTSLKSPRDTVESHTKTYICSNMFDLSKGMLNLMGILCFLMEAFIF